MLGAALENTIPFAATYELIRRGRRGLNVIAPISDISTDMLIGAGCVAEVTGAWVGNVSGGMGHNYRRAAETGAPHPIKIHDYSNFSIGMAFFAGAYVLAIGTAWAFSFTLLKRAHIRIDVLYQLLPLRVRALIDLVSIATLTGLGGVLVWYGTKSLFFAWSKKIVSITTLEIPLWIPMLAWDLGLIFSFMVALYLTVTSLVVFVRGDIAAIQARIGAVSGEEEVSPDSKSNQE